MKTHENTVPEMVKSENDMKEDKNKLEKKTLHIYVFVIIRESGHGFLLSLDSSTSTPPHIYPTHPHHRPGP